VDTNIIPIVYICNIINKRETPESFRYL